ncbi:PGF-CTERM sorting domain-containing protein [Halorussus limi]|uniref:PGF-CTERM sorting domain-containing protein n=1 Tax=Halorussus limi TaxID=2938695 RepID=A0A8U0HW10_9EURY|nr:BGTF surface domain-containing protein [Halorussus limi]UPV75272.1 PGF-CTERM sorting domain-containing protein [Halorussus limi]
MFDTALHRRVVLAALVALAGVAGVVAVGPATADDASTRQVDSAVARTDATNQSENLTASFVRDGEQVVLHPGADQTVRVQTNAENGTMLNLGVWVNGSFAMESIAEVPENGTATFPVDVNALDASTGSEVRLVVRHDDQKLAETAGVVKRISVEFVHDGDRIVLENAPNQTVEVRTDAEPGRELTVQMQSDKFVRTSPAVVGEDGTATATFDLSDVESGREITLQVASGDAETVGVILNESAMADETTTTDAPTETTTDGNETTAHGDNESSVPGFGVPVALCALAAGAALARRA